MALSGAQIFRYFLAIALCFAGAFASWQGLVKETLERDAEPVVAISLPKTSTGFAAAARRATRQGDFAGAIEPARQSLMRKPIDPATLRVLAVAQLQTRDDDEFAKSMTLASKLGWRDPPTQMMLFELAADSGDMTGAAIRLDALARQRIRTEQLKAAMREFLLLPGAPEALAERLAGKPLWRKEFLLATDPLPEEAYRPWLQMLAAMKQAGSAPTVPEYSAFEHTLLVFGKIPLAVEASRKVGALAARPADDIRSLTQGASVSPFVWSIEPGREASVSQPSKGKVDVTTNGQTGGPLFRRVFPITAGRHQLAVQVDEASLDANRAFRWTITCLPQVRELIPEVSSSTITGKRIDVVDFVVPADCTAARIALATKPGQIRQDYSQSLSNVRLD